MLAVKVEALVDGPVRLGVQQLERVVDALAIALLEHVEDQVGRVHLAGMDHVAELGPPALKSGHVAGEEIAVLAVERGQKAFEHQR